MNFSDKLKRLTMGYVKKDIAQKAGITPSVLNNYINRGSEPMASAAFRLAATLQVPLSWLLNNDADWPPPSSTEPSAPASSAVRAIGGGATLPGKAVTDVDSFQAPVAAWNNGDGAPFVLQPSDNLESTAVAIAARLVLAGGVTDVDQAAGQIVHVAKIILSVRQTDTTKISARPPAKTLSGSIRPKNTNQKAICDATIEATLRRILAHGKSSRRYACMVLKEPVFRAMCKRIINRSHTYDDTYKWLVNEVKNPPNRASFYRFANFFMKEFESVSGLQNLSSLPEKTG